MFNNLSKLLPKNYQLQVFVLSFLYFLLSLMEVVGIGSIPIFISAIIDDNYLQSKLNNIDYLNKFEIFKNDNLATIFLFIVLVIFFIKFIYQIFLFNYEAKFLKNVRFYLSSNVFSKFLHEEYKNYYNYNSSEVIRITLSDTERSLSFVRSVFNILKDSFMITVIILGLLVVDYKLTMIIFFLLTASGYIFYLFYKPLYINYGKSSQLDRQSLNRVTYESIGSIKNIKLSSLEESQIQKFIKSLANLCNRIKKIEFITKLPKPIFELITIYFFCALLIYFKFFNHVTPDLLLKLSFISLAIVRMLPTVVSLTSQFNSINNVKFSIDQTIKSLNELNNISIENKKNIFENEQEKIEFENLELKNLNFKYLGNENNALENINLKIKKGKIIGITGPSGSGKSTLVDLMMGLIEPSSGSIHINGKPLHQIRKNWLKLVGYIPQDVHLNDDTLKNNITFLSKDSFDDQKLSSAIKMSGLENLVTSKQNILDENVGEKGIKLSGGEKQRIGIARTLYKNSKILILDEPTSSLDENNEAKILENIFRLKNLTLIMITHKIYTLKKCDEILFIKNGKIVFHGQYDELINFILKNYDSLNF